MPKIRGMRVHKNRGNGFTVVSLHYTADPEKAKPEWKRRNRPLYSREQWEREQELNYDVVEGDAVYGDYDPAHHERNVGFDMSLPLIRGWDFGYRRPACVWCQVDHQDRFVILDGAMGNNVSLERFVELVRMREKRRFMEPAKLGRRTVDFEDYCDPYGGTQRSDKGEKTSVQILNSMGIHPQYSRESVASGIILVRSLLLPRKDRTYGLIVDEGCADLIKNGFKNGYKLDEDKETPKKDGHYEHVMDAIRYVATMKMSIQQEDKEEDDEEYSRVLESYSDPLVGYY